MVPGNADGNYLIEREKTNTEEEGGDDQMMTVPKKVTGDGIKSR